MLASLPFWLRTVLAPARQAPSALGVRHVMIAICDRFVPASDGDQRSSLARLEEWSSEFPKLQDEFSDASGSRPKHTFFYRAGMEDTEVVSALAATCQATGSEAEILLHGDAACFVSLNALLFRAKQTLGDLGLLSRDGSGELRFAVIRETPASQANGSRRHVGGEPVSDSSSPLQRMGCFAEFIVNPTSRSAGGIAVTDPCYRHSSDAGTVRRVRAHRTPFLPGEGELLLVPSPLALDAEHRRWGVFPRLDRAELSADQPPTRARLHRWLDCHISVESRPNWLFLALHTDSGTPANARMLLGDPIRAFHQTLAKIASSDPTLRFHYVTARELVNILHAAEAGHSGDPARFRDFRYTALAKASA